MQKSQFGQAEFILDLCNKVKTGPGHVFEAGGGDPTIHKINSLVFLENNWEGTIFEENQYYAKKIRDLQIEKLNTISKPLEYTKDGLNKAFEIAGITRQKKCNVLFLDINGGEYHLIDGLNPSRPEFICVECDNYFPLGFEYIPKYPRYGTQASQSSMYKMMKAKGYLLVKCFVVDMVFVAEEAAELNYSFFKQLGIYDEYHAANQIVENSYSLLQAVANQPEEDSQNGINFVKSKMYCVSRDCDFSKASIFINLTISALKDALTIVKAYRSARYYDTVLRAYEDIINEFQRYRYP